MSIRALHDMRRFRKMGDPDVVQRMARTVLALVILQLFVAPTIVFGQGSLTNVTATASDTSAGAGTIYTISFTTSAVGNGSVVGIPANGKIRLTFPAGFVDSTVSLVANVSGLTGGYLAPADTGQVLTLTRDGTGNNLPASSAAVFKIAVVGNSRLAGAYKLFIETLTNAGAKIDTATSAVFRIGPGPLHHVKVLNNASGNTAEVAAISLTADQTLTVHAGAFDAFGNYRGDVSVNWSVSGGIGTLSSAVGVSTIFNANKAGTGQITADHATALDDATGTITVTPGVLAKIFVVEGNSGDGPQLGTRSLTTDQSLTVHAAGYDADNNYISDQSVTWSITGGIGTLSTVSGSATTLEANTPGTGVINADHATVTDDATGIITVSLGAAHHIKVLSNASGNTSEVGTPPPLTAGSTLSVHASSFDADDNYIGDVSVNWSVSGGIGTLSPAAGSSTTLTAQTAGTGIVTADHATLIDAATGTITVNAGVLARVRIVEGASGNGPELGAKSVTTDQSLTVHAAGYDAFDNYVGDASVTWSVSGGIGTLSPGSGTSTTLFLTTPGSGEITADHLTASDDVTGTITVTVGAPHHVKVLSGANGNTGEVGPQSLTTGGTLVVHAGSFDADDNYIGDVSVAWTVSGGIGTVSPSSGTSTTFTATTVGTGVITANHATLIDDATGTITVSSGALSYVRIVEGTAGNGPELGAKALTTDQTLTVHAAGYDASNNYLGDQTVTWSVSGGIGALSTTLGTTTTLDARTPGSGTITAEHATATDDDSGLITVTAGAAHHVKVLSGASGNTPEVNTATLAAGQTLTVHASSFDADDNRLDDVSVNWTVSGGIGTLSPTTGVSTTLTATTTGSGVITADHATLIDDATGTITVSSSTLSYVKVVEGVSGNGPELGNKNVTTDETITVHAAGYDANNNYVGDVPVNWTVSGGIGAISPASGISATLNLTTPGSGVITADHATATDDGSGTINVSVGAPHHVKVLSGASGGTAEVGAVTLAVGGTLVVHASSFDADDNRIGDVSVSWSVSGGIGSLSSTVDISTTLTAQTVGSGIITADHATLIDDATGTITVNAGTLAKVRIVEGASGNGPEMGDKSVTTDQSLTVHAAGYDAFDNYLGDQPVSWSVSGGIGTLSPGSGASTTLTLTAPGSGEITADHATATDDVSGTITVTVGAAHHVKVLADLSGNTSEVGPQSLTTGGTLEIHAGSFDADDNYIGDVSVAWSVSGGIGTVNPGSGTGTTFTATTVGSGVITADHPTLIDDATGTITVGSGALSYIKIVEGTAGNGPELGDKTLTTDQTLTVHAAGYDASNNYLGDQTVAWSVSGGIGALSTTLGTTTTLDARTPGSGTITADHATATDDISGTITVNAGAAHHVKVLSGTSGDTPEVTTATLTAGQTLTVHASSFDADENRLGDVSVDWSVSGGIGSLNPTTGVSTTLTATAAGSGVITADHATLIDDATGAITVVSGTLSYVKIVEGPSGNGPELTTKTLTTDQTLTVHAAGYDASNNYLGDQEVTWIVSGGIGTLSTITGASTTLDARTPGTGTITADHATAIDDNTGTITVVAGVAHRVKVLSGASGATPEVTTTALTTGQTLVVHAGSFDSDDNYLTDVSVSWSVSGGIGNLNPAAGVSTTFTATTVGSGVITADHPTLIDDATGTITVTSGTLSYVKVVEGPSGNGPELGAKSLTTDQTLTVHAAGYDANNNYLGDQPVTWSVSGGIGTLSATTGTTTTLDAKTPGSGVITADHATATDDNSGIITVTAGVAHHVKVLQGAIGNTPEAGNATLTTGQTLVVHASSFDADDNRIADVSVNWSVSGGIGTLSPSSGISTTLTATTVGSGVITGDHATLIDDATGTIVVNSGTLSHVKIVEGPSGNGPELGAKSLTTDQTLTVHAAGYDANNNYLGDQTVTWSVSGGIGVLSTASGTSTTLDPRTPGSGVITADHATATDDNSGTITVTAGAPHHVKVLDGASGSTAEVASATLTTGQTLVVHASSFDADDNRLADVSVTWSVSGGIGTLNPASGISTTFTATTVGSGVITADHSTLIDDATGAIVVNSGNLSYVKIVEGPSGNGPELLTKNLTTDQTLTVHAAGYDASNNYLGDQSVNWSVSGGIGTLSTATGTATTLDAKTPGTGTITADHATALDDNSGAITVTAGVAHHIKILGGASGNTPEVTTVSLSTGETLVVHASSFDADDNWLDDVSVAWSVSGGIGSLNPASGISTTLTATTAGSGVIAADHATLIDDATGTITVTTGSLSYIKIVEGPSGNGPELGAKNLSTDQTLTVHAAGYDANNNYLGDEPVAWSVSGGIGTLNPSNGASTTLTLTRPGTGRISADHASATDDETGDLTVSVGALHHVKVLAGDVGNTAEVTSTTLTADEILVVHAGGFDADDNYTGDVSVSWSVSGGIGTLSPAAGVSTTLTARKVGVGQITADHPTAFDDLTGSISVTVGALAFIKIVEGPSGNGPELGARTLTADQTLTLHAAGFDADTNYVADQSVTWSSAGTLAPVVSGSGTSITFSPTLAPASGTIRGSHATAGFDDTGTITVNVGALRQVKVLSGPVGETTEVSDTFMNPGQTLVVHAGGFDADDNYISDQVVNWSVVGGIGSVAPANGISTTFTAGTKGTGAIRADHPGSGILDDNTGTITVDIGSVAKIILRTAPGNSGTAFNDHSMTADEEITVYAAGYDAGNNFVGDVNVTWASIGSLAPPASGNGSSFTFAPTSANAGGSVNGRIVGTFSPTIKDTTGTITVLPGNPSGNITLTATPSGLPSDGSSTSTIASSTIKDAEGNDVGPGKLFTVTLTPAALGTITTPDADGNTPGHQVATQANSQLSFVFRAGTTGGVVTVNVNSGLGASGNTQISLGSLNILSISTTPTTVSRGQTGISVSMSVQNLSTAPVTELAPVMIFTGSADRTGEYSITPSAGNPTTLAGSSTASLSFVVNVSAAATLETITISGTVSGRVNGTPVSASSGAQTDSWTVQRAATLTVQSVSTAPDTVSRGQTGLVVTVRVANNLGLSNSATANIDSVRLVFTQGALDRTVEYVVAPNPGNPTTIPGNSAADFSFIVNVGITASLGAVTLDASAYGKDANSNTPIPDLNATTTDSWVVIEGDAFRIVSLTPSQSFVTSGMTREWNVKMAVENTGSSTIALNLAGNKTFIRFTIGNMDVTGQYVIVPPAALDEGGTVLAARSTGHLTYRITQTGAKTGIAVISGVAEGQDNATGLPVSDNTNDAGNGEVSVQSPGALNITQVRISQPTVTANRAKDWTVTATVTNGGESAIQLLPDSTRITIGNNQGYVYLKPATFSDGTSIIQGNETKSLIITVDQTGSQTGDLSVSVTLKGTEINSNRPVSSNLGGATVSVQTPAALQILSVRASRQTVSAGQTTPWNVTVVVRNNGASQVAVKSDTSTNLRFRIGSQFQSGYSVALQQPTWLGTSSPILAGNGTDSLRFVVSQTGANAGFAFLWAKVAATETNSDVIVSATNNGSSVQVQTPPNVSYIAGSLAPKVVNNNSFYAFKARVRNTGGATVALNPATTRFRFSGGPANFQALLDANKVTSLGPGDTTLTFVSEQIPANMPQTTHTPVIELRGTHNANAFSVDLPVGANELLVSAPAQVQIVNVRPSQSTVTAGMTKVWSVFMVVANNGGASVKLDNVSLRLFSGVEVTGDFSITNPAKFIAANTEFLAAGATDSLRFDITRTGNREGNTTIQSHIRVIDQSNGQPIEPPDANTSVTVQSPAQLKITSLVASQPRVTINQIRSWHVDMNVTNLGGSEAELDLSANVTKITLSLNSGDYTIQQPSGLLSGGRRLAGGAAGTLRFTITRTGSQIGNNSINGQITARELNSDEIRADDTQDGGSTFVTVETPAQLRMKRTIAAAAPNLPFVNTNQTFSVQATVENLGQEAADSVKIQLATNGASQITPSIRTIAAGVSGGQSQTVTFNLTAAGSENPSEVFLAGIFAAKGRNSGANVSTAPALDDTAKAVIQRPAGLQILQVATSRSSVSAGQDQRWFIYVVVKDTGGAALTLDPPSRDNIRIEIDGEVQADYGITADPFLLRNRNLTLAGDQVDTLRYTVTNTGLRGGQAAIFATLTGRDKNNGAAVGDQKVGQIAVETTAALRILRTDPNVNRTLAEVGLVNSDQVFGIDVLVDNSGFEDVRDVVVRLATNGPSRILSPEQTIPDITARQSRAITFAVEADTTTPADAAIEIFTARIVAAQTSPGGEPANILQPADSTAQIRVQRPARLAIGVAIEDDRLVLTTNQLFSFYATVGNLGQAAIDGSGRMTLELPAGFEIVLPGPGAFERSFQAGKRVEWQLRAPDQGVDEATITVRITKRPLDLNSNDLATVVTPADMITVKTVPTDLAITKFFISAPDGATDGIVSTSQTFTLTANIAFSLDLTGTEVHLTVVPEGYTVVQSPSGLEDVVHWVVRAPDDPREIPAQFEARAAGRNGQNELVESVASVDVATVWRAILNFAAEISEPPGARDGILSLGQALKIRASLLNDGRAGIVDTAKVQLDLGQTGLTTTDPLEQNIDLGGSVQWSLKAPEYFADGLATIRLSQRPLDENSGASAQVAGDRDFVRIPVRTDSIGFLKVTNLAIVAPAGATDRILSTRQEFTLQAHFTGKGVNNVVAEVIFPPGSGFKTGDPVRNIGTLNGVQTRQWSIIAPGLPTLGRVDSIRVLVTYRDENDDRVPLSALSTPIGVEVVEQARLAISGRISYPPTAAADAIVSPSQPFEVTANLENNGQALPIGLGRIKLTLPRDGRLDSLDDYRTDEPLVKNLINNTATWQIRARNKPSTVIDNIRLELIPPYPRDQNTDSAATVEILATQIPIQTEPKRLVVQILPFSARGPVARGETSSLMMSLKLTNQGDLLSSNILLRGFRLHVFDRENQPLPANQVIKALRVVDANRAGQVWGNITAISATDTLAVPFALPDTLLGGVPDSLNVLVDVADNNAASTFRLAFQDSSDVDAIDQESGLPVEIGFVDERGNAVDAPAVTSNTRVFFDAEFQNSFYNFPNPFDPNEVRSDGAIGTFFNYFLPQDSEVELRIYTLLGELVYAKSYNATDPQGRQGSRRDGGYIVWDGKNGKLEPVLNGVYVAILKTSAGTATTKVAVVK